MNIKLLALDVDGVLTDGKIIMSAQGELCKNFHVHDGYGLKQVLNAGIKVVLITGRCADANQRRAEDLGITEVHQSIKHKLSCLEDICQRHQLDLSQCVYVGDDLPDLECITQAGTDCCSQCHTYG